MPARAGGKVGALSQMSFKAEPYWWEDRGWNREVLVAREVPESCDAVVVGAGITGVMAAWRMARAGLSVVVLEQGVLGQGASSRNNGMVVPYLKPSPHELEERFGPEGAVPYLNGGETAFHFVRDLIRDRGLDCDLEDNERFVIANRPGDMAHLVELAEAYNARSDEVTWTALSSDEVLEQTEVAGSEGGVLVRGTYCLHPGKYHARLVELAHAAGVLFVENAEVTEIGAEGKSVSVRGRAAPIRAGRVVVATNGYTGGFAGWLRRRIIPVRAYMACSEPVAPEVMARLFPPARSVTIAKRNLFWMRTSPDGTRVMFGGRAGACRGGLMRKAEDLKADVVAAYPELKDMGVSHCWEGVLGFSFGQLPHVGTMNGVHYAAGFSGVGLTFGSWLGDQLGRLAAGEEVTAGPFLSSEFETRPYYFGQPWFLPLVIAKMNAADRLDAWRQGRGKG